MGYLVTFPRNKVKMINQHVDYAGLTLAPPNTTLELMPCQFMLWIQITKKNDKHHDMTYILSQLHSKVSLLAPAQLQCYCVDKAPHRNPETDV